MIPHFRVDRAALADWNRRNRPVASPTPPSKPPAPPTDPASAADATHGPATRGATTA